MSKETYIVNAPNLTCPKCERLLDGFTANFEEHPKEGHYSICMYCASMLKLKGVGKHLHFEMLSAQEFNGLEAGYKAELVKYQLVVTMMKLEREQNT